MKNVILVMGMLLGIILVWVGMYGFIHDLRLWGVPTVFGLLLSGSIIEKVYGEYNEKW